MPATRDLHVDTVAEIAKGTIAPILLMYADFPSGAVRIWTGVGELLWDGEVWQGLGHMLALSEVEESRDTAADEIAVTVSGFRADFFDPTMLGTFVNRTATMWLGFVDRDTFAVVADPYVLFSGVMSHDEITDDGETAAVTMHCVSRLADLLRPREHRYTYEDQRLLHGSTDKGLEYVAELQDVTVGWGRPSNA